MSDIIITWPSSRPLESYIEQILSAGAAGNKHINFRVARLPKYAGPGDRCYVVHSGFVRGYNVIIECRPIEEDIVLDPLTDEFWPAGNYIVRDPAWYPITPSAYKGFQGWHYVKKGSLIDLSHGQFRDWESAR